MPRSIKVCKVLLLADYNVYTFVSQSRDCYPCPLLFSGCERTHNDTQRYATHPHMPTHTHTHVHNNLMPTHDEPRFNTNIVFIIKLLFIRPLSIFIHTCMHL